MRMMGLLIAIGIGAASPAAAQLVKSESVSVDNFAPQQIHGFDSDLGTLTRVEFLINYETQTGLIRPTVDPAAPPVVITISGIATLASLGGQVLADASVVGTRVYPAPLPTVDGYAFGFGSDALTDAGDLAFFTSALPKFIRAGGDLAVSSSDPTVFATGYERSRAAGTILYYYNQAAAAVPEPASWAMLIGGFGLVGGAMRRPTPALA